MSSFVPQPNLRLSKSVDVTKLLSMIITDFGGGYAAKRQSDIAWGVQPQDQVRNGLRPEGARD